MSPFDFSAEAGRHYVKVNALALDVIRFFAADLQYVTLEIALSSVLFGILTALVLVTVFFLLRNGPRRTPVCVLLLSTLLLYASTCVWMATRGWYIASVDGAVSSARDGLFVSSYTNADAQELSRKVSAQATIMTLTLGLNVVLGDSIVWWRACAVWRSKVVYCTGALLVILTIGFGVASIILGDHECPCHRCPCLFPDYLFQAGAFSKASAVLSLMTNVLATSLIACKAWQHRTVLRGNLSGDRKARVAKVFILLIESGTMYCILLILLVLYEVGPAQPNTPLNPDQSAFLRAEAYYTFGCFVPIVAIYPMLIIVLVAANRSPIENGLRRSPENEPGAIATASGLTTSNIALSCSVQSEVVGDVPCTF